MQFKTTALEGVIECYPTKFEDERGFFFESYNQKLFEANGVPGNFVQDNHSWSKPGVVRGLHFQYDPFAQGKLVRVITGKVIDVVVDIRRNSPTFGQHAKFELIQTWAICYLSLLDSHMVLWLWKKLYFCTSVLNTGTKLLNQVLFTMTLILASTGA
jgi:dTDP-4-dehydrorhamnose 3,5-epimerase